MNKIIVALDVRDKAAALRLVTITSPWVGMFKVGPILFLKYGPEIIREIRAAGKEVFLDLKFHDIPATVQRSVQSAQELGVYSLTIHASGGEDMIRAATKVSPRPKIWAVTVLTSQAASPARVLELAQLAKMGGADGVIASPLEIDIIKKTCGKDFAVVTPGIRIEDRNDDQKRTATPGAAVRAGADFIVVGRPIIEAPDPARAAQSIFVDIRF
jgi:orotidine-5'-phosphate decarboxylase